ncbi:pyridoxal phosphate-dependent decarboxylase family protein [Metabacillus sp. 84]|uniref:pyridoxal phosphate-dependent decarboxylase family protein n=1 Tax=Metabacillus sp. 84 TaxID=3404705 RepID=UPI003CF787FE
MDKKSLFLTHPEGFQQYKKMCMEIIRLIGGWQEEIQKPFSGIAAEDSLKESHRHPIAEKEGISFEKALKEVKDTIEKNRIKVEHPRTLAHLHCPPLVPALAADMLVSAMNLSMDSWDQSGTASHAEEYMLDWLTERYGLGEEAGGTFTSGGTQSNYMGLLLARDEFCRRRWNWNVQQNGLPPHFSKMKILCSEAAHFTVKKSASQLGLGEQSVVTVPVDDRKKIDLGRLEKILRQLKEKGELPFAIVATCGTTDFGSIDPLPELARVAREHQIWLHTDAAYGGALILSSLQRNKLEGIELSDSVTVDFHKLFYQPISCGAFLLKNKQHFRLIQHHADYLNPEEDEAAGLPHLVGKSIQTTRRFDVLKLYMSLRVVGTEGFARLIDGAAELAGWTAERLENDPDFKAVNPKPELTAVVFQYRPEGYPEEQVGGLNYTIHQSLLNEGDAVLAKTQVQGSTHLKFTILNPASGKEDIEYVLSKIKAFREGKA